jgi:hypothetical protein
MPEASFANEHNYTIATLQMESQAIRAGGGPLRPHLNMQGKVTIDSARASSLIDPMNFQAGTVESVHAYTLLDFSGTVVFKMGNVSLELAEVRSEPDLACRRSPTVEYPDLVVALDPERVREIERYRTGDIRMELTLRAFFATHEPYPAKEPPKQHPPIVGFFHSKQRLELTIPQSDWTTKHLAQLGYDKLRLVEIPTPAKAVPPIYSSLLVHLEDANKRILAGDYDGAVASCRKVVEHIPTIVKMKFGKPVPPFRDRVAAFMKQELSARMDEAQQKALVDIVAGLYSLGNKAVHKTGPAVYGRADAESINAFTTILVSYVGRLLEAGA